MELMFSCQLPFQFFLHGNQLNETAAMKKNISLQKAGEYHGTYTELPTIFRE